ncbi:MAG: putative transposase [Patescibacteria group bacterium]
MKDEILEGLGGDKTIRVEERDGSAVLLVKGREYMSWRLEDEGSRRMAIVQLYETGTGTQEQLAEAFGIHVNTVQNYVARFARDGLDGLLPQARGPRNRWKLTAGRRGKILMMAMREGVTGLEAIQKRLRDVWGEDLSLPSIREVLSENGLIGESGCEIGSEAEQGELFEDESGRQLSLSFGSEAYGNDEKLDGQESVDRPIVEREEVWRARERSQYSSRQRAYLDLLEQGGYNAYAGGLLFTALIERYGFLKTLRRVIRVSTHEGYSMEELCLTLLYADVFGFRSMEDFKRAYSEEFGMLIGRSHSPSVFTLRRFLHKVRTLKKGEDLIDEFAVSYLKGALAKWGVMYIDGHFLPYYGMYSITKGWHGVRQIAMKGSYNFLAVDGEFRPWLFLIRSSSEDLLEKIPELIEKAKKLGLAAGLSAEAVNKLIVLFDREGYSAELYRYLEGKDQGEGKRRAIFVTWAKYADKWVNEMAEESLDQTAEITYAIRKPQEVRYVETHRTMNKYGKIRAIVIQSGKEKQRAAIYTNATVEELGGAAIAQLMCRRWGEENRIKELLLRHEINYMPGYVLEGLDEQPWVNNPKVRELKKKRAELVSELRQFKVQLAEEVLKQKQAQPVTVDNFPVLENIVRVENEILLVNGELDGLPGKVRFNEAHDGKELAALNYEKKRFLDCIKVFVCNLTEAMCQLLLKYYDRRKEILPALSMIVERAGDVKMERGQVRVTLRRFANPEIDYAARRLCEELNAMRPRTLDRFRLPLRYEVA